MTTHPPIPDDIAARGWHYNDCGFLVSSDGLLIIARPCPFEIARALEERAERLREQRKPRQTEMKLWHESPTVTAD